MAMDELVRASLQLHVAINMKAKRDELIAQPLARIWNELSDTAIATVEQLFRHEETRLYVQAEIAKRYPNLVGFHFTPGTDPKVTKEQVLEAALSSMERNKDRVITPAEIDAA